jgi:2-oxoglutarate dehydrogenase E2 component (dihydrolipoamide succinyltransferase)
MAIDIVVPSLGESITEGTIANWLKQVGEAVAVDEPLVELETDKATIEICAPKAGVLSEIRVAAGEDVEIGELLGRIDEAAGAAAGVPPDKTGQLEKTAPDVPAANGRPPMADARTAGELDPARAARSGPRDSVTLPDLLDFAGIENADWTQSGPAIRRLVAEHGLDPGEIPATGRDGRITKEDVQKFLSSRGASPVGKPGAQPSTPRVRDAREERVRMSRMRRTIATRLKEAQNTAAILTTFNEVDMSAVRGLRSRYRDDFEKKHGVRLGFTSFFAKACVAALKEVPAVNAEIDGDEIVYKHYYDIGMAVSTERGLVVPVIRDCDSRSFAEIERSLGELAGKARDGSLTTDEMQGGTFSITNGGVFGSLLSTPILNRPQSAILGLHKIEERPVAVEGEVAIRPMMYLALSYDHRIVDGREAVTFLVKVKEEIENPERSPQELDLP